MGDEDCFRAARRKFERAWSPTEASEERKFSSSEDFPRWGKSSGAARNKPRQDPIHFITKTILFELFF